MKRGVKPQLLSTKRAKGTYKPVRDAVKIELTPVISMAGGGLPQRPPWLTATGEEV